VASGRDLHDAAVRQPVAPMAIFTGSPANSSARAATLTRI
jgi:hypothetical protein